MASKECVKHFYKVIYLYSWLPLFLLGGWVSYQIFKKRSLTESQFLEREFAGKKGGDFFEQGGGRYRNFYLKHKLKSEILTDKKYYKSNMSSTYLLYTAGLNSGGQLLSQTFW